MIKSILCGKDEDNKFYVQQCCGEEHLGQQCECKSLGLYSSLNEAKKIAYAKGKELSVEVKIL